MLAVRNGPLVVEPETDGPLRVRELLDVRDEGVDGAGGVDDLGGHHLGAGAVLGLGAQDEALVGGEVAVPVVVVVSGGSATITHAGIGAASSSTGKLLYKGAVSPNISVSSGVTPRLTTASTITED